jgi:hypothetical protein
MTSIGVTMGEPVLNDYTNLDFDIIQYNFPVERNNCKYIDILNNDQDILLFKTPELKIHNVIEKNENQKYVDLVINEENKTFFEFIANIDDHNMLNVYHNSKRWFKKTIPLDILDDFHKPILKIKKSGNAIFRTLLHAEEFKLSKGDKAYFTIRLDAIKILKREFLTQWIITEYKQENMDYEFGDDILDHDIADRNSNYNFDLTEKNLDENNKKLTEPVDDNKDVNKDNILGSPPNEILDNNDDITKLSTAKIKSDTDDIKVVKLEVNNKNNRDNKNVKKKKRIIYSNKEKIWNN